MFQFKFFIEVSKQILAEKRCVQILYFIIKNKKSNLKFTYTKVLY